MVIGGLLGLAVCAVALAASCAEPSGGAYRPRPVQTGSAATTAPTPSATMPSAEVPRGLRFTEPRLGGGTVRGADFAGHDLVMWFWAPW